MYKKIFKRMLDIIGAVILLPILSIILVVVSVLIFIEDRGPVFYKGKRLGKNGKVFPMYKFRSMKVNAPDLRNADGSTFNSEKDDRVTHIGRLLRKTSIDEIPQILNVLKGDMSFIGPRPDLPDAMEIYSEETRKKLNVRPGITGFSQAYYRNASTLEERFTGDVYYAENVSLFLDIKILFKTVQTVLLQKNVYRNVEKDNADQ